MSRILRFAVAAAISALASTPALADCPWSTEAPVYASASMSTVTVGGQSFFVRGGDSRTRFVNTLKSCETGEAAQSFEQWRASRRATNTTAIVAGAGTPFLAPLFIWTAVAANKAKVRKEEMIARIERPRAPAGGTVEPGSAQARQVPLMGPVTRVGGSMYQDGAGQSVKWARVVDLAKDDGTGLRATRQLRSNRIISASVLAPSVAATLFGSAAVSICKDQDEGGCGPQSAVLGAGLVGLAAELILMKKRGALRSQVVEAANRRLDAPD